MHSLHYHLGACQVREYITVMLNTTVIKNYSGSLVLTEIEEEIWFWDRKYSMHRKRDLLKYAFMTLQA